MGSWMKKAGFGFAVVLAVLLIVAIPVAIVGGLIWALWTSSNPTPINVVLTGLVLGGALLVLDRALSDY